MSVNITTRIKGMTSKQIEQDIKVNQNLEWAKFREIGERAAQRMRQQIVRSLKNSNWNYLRLVGAIYVEHSRITAHDIQWGIGELTELQKEFPYWSLINSGGKTKPHIIRARTANALSFINREGNKVVINSVHHPGGLVRPINFIERTNKWIGLMFLNLGK